VVLEWLSEEWLSEEWLSEAPSASEATMKAMKTTIVPAEPVSREACLPPSCASWKTPMMKMTTTKTTTRVLSGACFWVAV